MAALIDACNEKLGSSEDGTVPQWRLDVANILTLKLRIYGHLAAVVLLWLVYFA
jgi:hypothetical protein